MDEEPPFDRFCDLVLTGGVASGVVYPWAIVELARHFRFRNIGGTSVGAMAAALAAAAEYGRRTGYEAPFETLRRLPAALGEELPDGRTRMLSLFQPCAHGKRFISLWGKVGRGRDTRERRPKSDFDSAQAEARAAQERSATLRELATATLKAYRQPLQCGALAWSKWAALLCLVGLAGALLLCLGSPCTPPGSGRLIVWLSVLAALGGIVTVALLALMGALHSFGLAVWADFKHGLIENGYGLCKGGTLEPRDHDDERPGLSQWLHEGIQSSAGLKKSDRPLTFRDLWSAPAYPGAVRVPCDASAPVSQRAINLQTFTTNLSHERPYRLPLEDRSSWLYFKPEELEDYFPPDVLTALTRSARPYRPLSGSDPPAERVPPGILELPDADLPIVVAARLSLSFPFLFSAVPLWAVDYEAPIGERTLRRCQFTDGGASSNFPIHLFDASIPRWPTFGLWLDRKGVHRPWQDFWLPNGLESGRGDDWNRFDPLSKVDLPGAAPTAEAAPRKGTPSIWDFLGFIGAIAKSAADWRDRTSLRLPNVRHRVARLKLATDEGGLNIGMRRAQILDMAHRYGTSSGQAFAKAYLAPAGTDAAPKWTEHRWVRMELLVAGLRERLKALSGSITWAAYSEPMDRVVAQAADKSPLRGKIPTLNKEQVASLQELLGELERLGDRLELAPERSVELVPEPELRLRPPL